MIFMALSTSLLLQKIVLVVTHAIQCVMFEAKEEDQRSHQVVVHHQSVCTSDQLPYQFCHSLLIK